MPLQVTTYGSGSDIALLHGWGFGRGIWKPVVNQLSTYYRVHLVSLPGYDGTSVDSRDFDATAYALTEALPPRSILCGWSMGGMLALAAAAHHPNHFARLVLVGTTPKFVQASDWTPALSDKTLEAFLRWVLQAPEATLASFVTLLSRPDSQMKSISNHLKALLANDLPDVLALEKGLDWLRNMDLRRLAAQVSLPTLIVHGDQDPLIPVSAATWLTAALPCARLRLCTETAHAPFASNPGHFCTLLIEFFSEPI